MSRKAIDPVQDLHIIEKGDAMNKPKRFTDQERMALLNAKSILEVYQLIYLWADFDPLAMVIRLAKLRRKIKWLDAWLRGEKEICS